MLLFFGRRGSTIIYIIGDIHGIFDIDKMHKIKPFVTKEDTIITLGDFGLLWEDTPNDLERKLISFYDSFPCDILWIDGNHENFNRIDKLSIEKRYGGNVGVTSRNIFHLMRGEIYTIEGKSFFAMGGANSID